MVAQKPGLNPPQFGPAGVAYGTLSLAIKPCSCRELSYGSCPECEEGVLSSVEPALDQVTGGQTDAHDLVEAKPLLKERRPPCPYSATPRSKRRGANK